MDLSCLHPSTRGGDSASKASTQTSKPSFAGKQYTTLLGKDVCCHSSSDTPARLLGRTAPQLAAGPKTIPCAAAEAAHPHVHKIVTGRQAGQYADLIQGHSKPSLGGTALQL